MATVINTTPAAPAQSSSGSGIGFVVGILLLIGFFLFLLYFGLPYARSMMQSSTPSITVPEKIDVNVNQQPSQ